MDLNWEEFQRFVDEQIKADAEYEYKRDKAAKEEINGRRK